MPIKFTLDEKDPTISWMYCTTLKGGSPLIKIPTKDATPEKFGSITDEEFNKNFNNNGLCICGCGKKGFSLATH